MTEYLSKKITALSFLAILIVVLLHSYNLDTLFEGKPLLMEKDANWLVQQFISNGLTRIAVPLFFVISGFLFFLKFEPTFEGYASKVKKRMLTLFVPYVLWSFLGIALYFTLQSIPQSRPFFSKGLIRDYSFTEFLDRLFLHPIPYQFWFIRDLIILVLLSWVIFYMLKATKFYILTVFFAVWIAGLDYIILDNRSLLFFSVGAAISIRKSHFLSVDFSKKAVWFLVLWILSVAIKTALEFIDFGHVFAVSLIYNFSILAGMAAFWSLYDRLFLNCEPKTYLNSSLFGLTFFIFAIHEPLLTIIKKVLFAALGKDSMDCLAIYFLAPIIVFCIAVVAGKILRKYLAPCYNILTGDR
jgi:surface polysaccharide O-acyltransferase-like enzyme